MRNGERRTAALLFALAMVVSFLSAAYAEEAYDRPTPEEICGRMNKILANAKESGQPLADRVNYDSEGGFAFCTEQGESALLVGEAGVRLRGGTDESGRMEWIELYLRPEDGFSGRYFQQADGISRVYMVGVFSDLPKRDLETLMAAYWYEIAPYRYREGDAGIVQRAHTCELELQGEVARFESEATEQNELRLGIFFVRDADGDEHERAQQSGWRVRRLAQTVSECKMIATCGECLAEIAREEMPEKLDDAAALIALCEENMADIAQLNGEKMTGWEAFLQELQAQCALLDGQMTSYRAACEAEDMDAVWNSWQEICATAALIGNMPESLY